MLKKQLDWLWSVIRGKGKVFYSIEKKYAIALDGYRIHAINLWNTPNIIFEKEKGKIEDLFNGKAEASFVINPQYLIDALQVFIDDVEIIVLGNEQDGTRRIYIGNDGPEQVVIMCKEATDG